MVFAPAPETASVDQRLAAFSFAAELSPSTRSVLVERLRPVHFSKDEALLKQGRHCEQLFLLERGVLRVYSVFPNGREITLYRVSPGELCVLCASCTMEGVDFPAQLMAKSGSTALSLDVDTFRKVFSSDVACQRYVLSLFTRRIATLMTLIQEVTYNRMDERLARFLLRTAKVENGELAPIRMSHEEIADDLGTAREVVSRLLEGFEEKGLVSLQRRNVTVRSADGLRKITKPSGTRAMEARG
jgi:CRP/FNR family transcriptional regulator